ncbi:MAG: MBL fold metallo-hydrolase [Patescibacteria group bacterium]
MVIQYFGKGEARVSQGDWNLAFAGGKLRLGGRDGFEIDGPGEYEIAGTFIRAVTTDGPDGKINTAYSVLFDDIRLVYLGNPVGIIKAEAKEILADADILFTPSLEYATALEPKVIVPMPMNVAGNEIKGKNLPKPVDKLVIKRKDLEDKEGEVITIWSS